MPRDRRSLLAGRNQVPLSAEEVRRAVNTFLGLDDGVTVRYEEAARTVFRVDRDERGEEYGEVVFGPDVYPGPGILDANSGLSVDAAAAHELNHYYRWRNKAALPEDALEHLDEALTSLGSILRFRRQLSENDIAGLVADAVQRLNLYVEELKQATPREHGPTRAVGENGEE